MSDHGSFPPPGQVPPGTPPPAQQPPHGQQPGPPAGWRPPAPGMLGAAHKPGAIALRPLALGDIFDGAFRIIRFNPGATVGAAVLVAAVAMAIPVAITSFTTVALGGTLDRAAGTASPGEDMVGFVAAFGSLMGGSVLLQIGLLLVTGVVAHVTHEAAVGRRIGLGEAWAMTRGRRWRLVALVLLVAVVTLAAGALWVGSVALLAAAGAGTVVVVLYGVLSGLLFVVLAVWLYVRATLLSAPALMLEDLSVLGAVRRSWRLTRSQFWRVLGIGLLAGLVAGIAGFVLGLPFGLLTQLGAVAVPEHAVLVLVVGQALSSVVTAAFTAPFTASVTTLQYLDQRMRKEAYDVTLMARAGITGA